MYIYIYIHIDHYKRYIRYITYYIIYNHIYIILYSCIYNIWSWFSYPFCFSWSPQGLINIMSIIPFRWRGIWGVLNTLASQDRSHGHHKQKGLLINHESLAFAHTHTYICYITIYIYMYTIFMVPPLRLPFNWGIITMSENLMENPMSSSSIIASGTLWLWLT
jgi:hypothetical protein